MSCPVCGGEDFSPYPDPFDYGEVNLCGGCGYMEKRSSFPWGALIAVMIAAAILSVLVP